MRWMTLAWLLILPLVARADLPPANGGKAESALQVVRARMQALNAHDLEAFLALYAPDVQISVYPDQPLTSGKAELAEIFQPLIAEGDVEVVVGNLIAVDSFVVVERVVSYGTVSEPGVAIYEVQDGLIVRVQFLRDTRRAKRIPRQTR